MHWTIQLGGFFLPVAMAAIQSSSGDAPRRHLSGTASLPPGFLPRDQLPNSLTLLPPPPQQDSPAFHSDVAAARRIEALKNSARWKLAASDADLAFPHAPGAFACAAGVKIGFDTTPSTYQLLAKSMVDVGLSTYAAKNHYARKRPFVSLGSGTCYPKDEEALRTDGSYPSGHSAVGWGWALILAELLPDRADAILLRGREYGQSRSVCGAHWQSDVDAGRLVAAATVARLHGDPAFLAAVAAAKRELDNVGRQAAPDQGVCAAESAALTPQQPE